MEPWHARRDHAASPPALVIDDSLRWTSSTDLPRFQYLCVKQFVHSLQSAEFFQTRRLAQKIPQRPSICCFQSMRHRIIPGARLRAARVQLGLTLRDVEAKSRVIAAERADRRFAVPFNRTSRREILRRASSDCVHWLAFTDEVCGICCAGMEFGSGRTPFSKNLRCLSS